MTWGEGGVKKGPKTPDVIYGQPLMQDRSVLQDRTVVYDNEVVLE